MTESSSRPDTASVDPSVLAVDALPDGVRASSTSPDETDLAQLNPGDLVATSPVGDDVADSDGVSAGDGEDTTVRARQANDLLDPPGPDAGRSGQGADGDVEARTEQAEHGGP